MSRPTALRFLARAGQALVPRARGGVHVLAYHLVDGRTGSSVDLGLDVFGAQMEELASFGCVVSLPQAVERLGRQDAGSGVTVVLTFDDAYRNFRTVVFPVLEELRLPATLYVPTGFVEGDIPGPLSGAEELPALSWAELAELLSSGLVTVGSHTHSHADLRSLEPPAIRGDLDRAVRLIEDRLGVSPEHFSYPRAFRSRAAEREVARFHRTAVGAGGRRNRPGAHHPLRLSRVPLRCDMPRRLEPILRSSVWIEEWVANGWRRVRH